MAAVVLCIPERGLASFVARIAAGGISYATVALALDVLSLRSSAWRAVRRLAIAGHASPAGPVS